MTSHFYEINGCRVIRRLWYVLTTNFGQVVNHWHEERVSWKGMNVVGGSIKGVNFRSSAPIIKDGSARDIPETSCTVG